LQGFKALLEDFTEPDADPGVKSTDRADIIIGKILELCPGLDPAMGFASLLVVHIVTERTEIPGRVPQVKPPLADPSFPPLPADRADIGIG
jgi:hypothetical protein